MIERLQAICVTNYNILYLLFSKIKLTKETKELFQSIRNTKRFVLFIKIRIAPTIFFTLNFSSSILNIRSIVGIHTVSHTLKQNTLTIALTKHSNHCFVLQKFTKTHNPESAHNKYLAIDH